MGNLTEDYMTFIELPNEFLEKYWTWFDSLSQSEKKKYWNYERDMSHQFYYTKIFMQKNKGNVG